MADVRDKLKALLDTKGVMTGSQWRTKLADLEQRRASGEFDIDNVVPGQVFGDEDDAFYLVRQDFPLDTEHGGMTLGSALEAIPENISLSANDDELRDFNPETAVFIDTETTGLMGGTGTVTFLVGVGYFTEGVFRLDQCFMRDFDEEEPMLNFCQKLFADAETVVSYNGKSFDLPLLRTRFITNRIPFRLEGAMHFDLVHAARRFWKKRLGDCSLGNVERKVLGLERHGDVAGADIPRIWLDYLHTRDARKLGAVFYHHKMDILSLVTLTALLSQSLDVPDGQGFTHHEDRLSLVRIHYRQKRYQDVLDLSKSLLETLTDEVLRAECLENAALAAKRLRQWDLMEDHLTLLHQESPKNLLARLELAKHYEHHKHNLQKAAQICQETIELLDNGDPTFTAHVAAFQHRLHRLQRKLQKQGIDPDEPSLDPT